MGPACSTTNATDFGSLYSKNVSGNCTGFCDSDWVDDGIDD